MPEETSDKGPAQEDKPQLELDWSKPKKTEDSGPQTEDKKKPEGILVIKGSEENVQKMLEEGGIEVRFYIESHGAKGAGKEEVAEALKNTILKDLKNEPSVAVREIKFHPVIEKEGMYSGFVEVVLAAEDFRVLVFLTARYGPAAAEVIHPEKISLNKADMENLLADVSGTVTQLTSRMLELMDPEIRDKRLREGLNL